MNRLTDDIFARYFRKQAVASLIFFFVVGAALCAAGFNSEGSRMFLIIGVLFFVMAGAQFIRDRVVKVSGSQIDEHIKEMVRGIKLRRNALEKLCIEDADVENAKVATLQGFSGEPIDTAPYMKNDALDGRPRTSNYQLSMLFFCRDRFYTYSDMRSLVDKERRESGKMWRYGNVESCYIETVERTFPIKKDGSETDTAVFRYLTVTGRKGEHFCFAFDGTDDGETNANAVIDFLAERVAIARGNRADAEPVEEVVANAFFERDNTTGLRGSREKRVSDIGRIGDSMGELGKEERSADKDEAEND